MYAHAFLLFDKINKYKFYLYFCLHENSIHIMISNSYVNRKKYITKFMRKHSHCTEFIRITKLKLEIIESSDAILMTTNLNVFNIDKQNIAHLI